VLVVASDCRLGAPSSGLERSSGDGAAAFLVSAEDVVAELTGAHAVADEIVDLWRAEGDAFVHSWEDRFVVQEVYAPRIEDAVRGLLAKTGTSAGDYSNAALYAPDQRSHAGAARALGFAAGQVAEPLFGRLGNAGVAFAPLLLAAALEGARAGDRLLVANYGDGADALAFAVTDQVAKLAPRRGVAWNLARRRPVASYDHYLKARGLTTAEWEAPAGPGLSATIHHRDRDNDLSFRGQKCNACGAVQFPAQRVCETCFAKDDFEPYRLSDRIGKLVTFTFDYFFPTPEPPTVVSVVDIDGARVHIQVVDLPADQVKIGTKVEFEFRRIHNVGGRPNYYWKAAPVPEPAE